MMLKGEAIGISKTSILRTSIATHNQPPNVYNSPGGLYASMDPIRTDPCTSPGTRSLPKYLDRLANSPSALGRSAPTPARVANHQRCRAARPDSHLSGTSPTSRRHAAYSAGRQRPFKTHRKPIRTKKDYLRHQTSGRPARHPK